MLRLRQTLGAAQVLTALRLPAADADQATDAITAVASFSAVAGGLFWLERGA